MNVLLFAACSAPVEAPEDFNELMSYIFLHTMTEDDAVLDAGITNLLAFSAENLEVLQEGYAIENLSQASLDSTGVAFPPLDDVYGVALQYSVDYPSRDIAYCNTAVDGEEVYSANYISYDRESLSDLDCFLARTCPTFRYRSTIRTSLPLGAEMLSRYINELRWVDQEEGTAFIQRAWMDGDAESSASWADMTANFYLGYTYDTPAGSETIAASWAAIQMGELALPEDLAKSQAIDGLRSNGTDLNAWLSENEVPN